MPSSQYAKAAVDGVEHPVQVGQVVLLEPGRRVRGGVAADPQHRRLQVVEALLGDPGGDLGAEPAVTGASCTTTHRPVLRTEPKIVSVSSGDSERRSMTSIDGPSSAAATAASTQVCTIGP